MIPRTPQGRPDIGRWLNNTESTLDALERKWPLGAVEAATAALAARPSLLCGSYPRLSDVCAEDLATEAEVDRAIAEIVGEVAA